jgi:hypothetical protein
MIYPINYDEENDDIGHDNNGVDIDSIEDYLLNLDNNFKKGENHG